MSFYPQQVKFLSNRHRLKNTFMILKSFNEVISDIIDDVIVKIAQYTQFMVFWNGN